MATQDDASPPLPTALGPYTILQRIAVGGMSEVFLASARQAAGADRTVVIKRMLPKVAEDPAMRQMFSDEAALGARVRHPNVVEVLDFLTPEGAQPVLALEYVQGLDLWQLGRWLTREGRRLPCPVAVYIARQMLMGLHAVHEARDEEGQPLGVVHRDVSPSNVLVSVHGDVKLGDLGIAQAAARERYPRRGADARAKGKLGYLAPEQVRGHQPDQRSDIFSAAVVAAELLMGRPLFAGGSELAVLLAIRDSKIHPFLEFSSQLPDGLGEVITQALAAHAEDRPNSAMQLARRLRPYEQGARVELRRGLAEHVRDALGTGIGRRGVGPPASPTQALAHPFEALGGVLPPEAIGAGAPTAGPLSQYEIRTVAGEQLGPWPYAKVVQAVSTGMLGPMDQVSLDGGNPRMLNEFPNLARHVPGSSVTTQQGADNLVRSGALVPLSGGSIVAELANAAVDRFTGLLLCERGSVRKEVYLKEGTPAFVTSNQAGELLGEHLVARGVISRSELDMALAVMPRFEGRLGDTLAALGLVEPVSLFRHIGEQVREKLLDLFLWDSGSCTRYVGVSPPESSFPLELQPWEVIDEGLDWRVTAGLEETSLKRAATSRVERIDDARLAALLDTLPGPAARMLGQLSRPAVAQTLWQAAPDLHARTQLQRTLLLLLHLSALKWAD